MKTKIKLFGLIFFVFASALIWSGCGGSSITDPNDSSTEQTPGGSSGDTNNGGGNNENGQTGGNGGEGGNTSTSIDFSGAKVIIDSTKIKNSSWEIWTYSLSKYNEKTVTIEFSADVAVENTSGSSVNLLWQVNKDKEYPIVAQKTFANGTTNWVTVTGTKEVTLGTDNLLYLAKPATENLKIYMKNINISITEHIDGADATNMGFYEYNLASYGGKKVTVKISVYMKVENSGESANLMWQINESSYPILASHTFANGTSDWVKVEGTYEADPLGENKVLYLSKYEITPENLKIYLKDLVIEVIDPNAKKWTSVLSLRDAYVPDLFDYFGIAIGLDELSTEKVQDGLRHHVNSITMGNEMKPDSILWHLSQPSLTISKFTGSNGVEVNVPNLNFYTMDQCLTYCKAIGAKMRGHVLTWHSQTPNEYFYDNFETTGTLYTAEQMTARHEYYIKTVLNHVKEWEEQNNGGNRIIYAWDVVNEAVADDAGDTNWLRGSTTGSKDQSMWYKVYGDESFIVNAFKFANQYAPKDVLLCYNDYNENSVSKCAGMLKIIDAIKAEPSARIDVMAMQSHADLSWSTVADYKTSLEKFLAKGVDVHISELDIGLNQTDNGNDEKLAEAYTEWMQMCIEKRKVGSVPGVTGITIWGINDENTWLNGPGQKKDWGDRYPLLFKLDSNGDYIAKDAFFAVLNAAGQ